MISHVLIKPFFVLIFQILLLRHNLDVMHIEKKNICESIVGTLLNTKRKTKGGENINLPPRLQMLTQEEKEVFCKRLLQLKLLDGYSSNISSHVSLEDCKILGLKSYDCHVLLQQLLPVALMGLLSNEPRIAIFRLCSCFNELCQKFVDKNKLESLDANVAETLCMFERYFPPCFFDVMVHLTIHLSREALVGGPVQFRWMYPFERYSFIKFQYVHIHMQFYLSFMKTSQIHFN